jgi:hypothetical protein
MHEQAHSNDEAPRAREGYPPSAHYPADFNGYGDCFSYGDCFCIRAHCPSRKNKAASRSLEASAPLAKQNCSSLSPISLEQWQHSATSPTLRSRTTFRESTQAIHRTPTMPRARGKPRRGAAWYTAESRRKRKENFEKAMAMAAKRRRNRPRTPPMAYVEEVIPEGGLESPPEHTLFMVPENWNPSSNFGRIASHRLQAACSALMPPAQRRLTPPATWKRRFLPNLPRKRRGKHKHDNGTRAGSRSGHPRGVNGQPPPGAATFSRLGIPQSRL